MQGIIDAVQKVDGLIECDACGRYFPEMVTIGDEAESQVVKSDMCPKSNRKYAFYARGCRVAGEGGK